MILVDGVRGVHCEADFGDVILSWNGEQVIPKSGAISSHMEQCAAIAEIESGEILETSLLAAPEGKTHIQPTLIVYNGDPWANEVLKPAGSLVGRTSEVGLPGTLSTSQASVALLSLNASKCSADGGKVVGKDLEGADGNE